MRRMKTPVQSRSEGVRLNVNTWPKLRALMTLKGRGWLEKAIDREFRKSNLKEEEKCKT